MHQLAKEEKPTLFQAIAFGFKASCFRTRRSLQNLGGGLERFPRVSVDDRSPVIAESRSLLYSSGSRAEFALQSGKVHNLRIAARYLNGIQVDADKVFSFWKHLPRPGRWRGFSKGRELREGCIIPSVGGGLCQLSNALYDCALKADLEIVERHGHSRVLPDSMAEQGRDATLFWNYVDLRFRFRLRFQIEVILGRGELVVRFRGDKGEFPPASQRTGGDSRDLISESNVPAGDPVESCETCGVTSCFRHPETLGLPETSLTAWLVDAYWPEYDLYLTGNSREGDWLFTPISGRNYRWNRDGFSRVLQFPRLAMNRSIASRRLAQQGAARQRALLEFDRKLANGYATRIPASALHLVVSQNLLPFLWRSGALGGRTFDVLMTRLPLTHLEDTLDRAARRWPESETLSDFRADPELLKDETDALAEADHWITPHSGIAEIAGDRAIKLDWEIPRPSGGGEAGARLLFPASTLGRKGAWELRSIGLPLTLTGPVIESPDFWSGVEVERRDFSLEGVAVAVLPAWVENQPRRLLEAVAAGIPVIATDACGLGGVDGVTVVEAGNTEMLEAAIDRFAGVK
ncbi:MAG: VanW family protein [Verrucomicrobiales bacterium]|nr:VanW family protein [Verrucomicrobiales bacterium]